MIEVAIDPVDITVAVVAAAVGRSLVEQMSPVLRLKLDKESASNAIGTDEIVDSLVAAGRRTSPVADVAAVADVDVC